MSAIATPVPAARARRLPAVQVWQLYLVTGAVAVAAYYRLGTAGWGQCILLTTLNATAFVAAAVTACRTRGWRLVAWASLAIAMLLSAVGNAGYFGNPLVTGQPLPFPSKVDALLLAAFPFFAIALVALSRAHRPFRLWSLPLTAIVAGGGALVLWKSMVTPTARSVAPLPHFDRLVSVAYPELYVGLFVVLVAFVLGARRWNLSSATIVASYAVALAGQLVFSAQMADGTYKYGGPVDALWMVSYLLIGVATLHPSARRRADS